MNVRDGDTSQYIKARSKAQRFYVWGVFGKYVDNFNRMRIKHSRQMKFCINEYQLFNIKCDQYENLTLINDLDIGHQIG